MTRSAPVVAMAALALSMGLVPAASARTVCPLVSDPAGDATGGPAPQASRDDLDILSLNLKVVRGVLTSVLHIKKLPEGIAPGAGGIYDVFVTRDDRDFVIHAHVDSTGPQFSVQTGSVTDPTSPYRVVDVTGTFDLRHNEVRVVAPLSAFSVDGGPGTSATFSEIGGQTAALAGSDLLYVGSSVDDAGGAASFVVGQRACF